VPLYVAPKSVMSAVAGFDLHRGCLALGEPSALLSLPSALEAATRSKTVLVLEAIANHDNVGASFRNARGFGVGAIFLDPRCADPLYRKAIRVSMGATLTVPFARMADWPGDLSKLEASGFSLAALTPRADAIDLVELARGSGAPPSKIALVLGTEGEGLSSEVLERAHYRWRIPMAEGADSLNVAVASAVALFALEAGARSRPR
jgi:tRNA G18 (ribose-2'-O)-methylase SpoU